MQAPSDPSALPLRTVLSANDVVAIGRSENVLQVPSPIYTAAFVDTHHVLIGAGGGGRRFGMPNIAMLLHVQSLVNAATPDVLERPAGTSQSTPPPVWRLSAAIDLGPDDIPWCTSSFLSYGHPAASRSDQSVGSSRSSSDPAALDWTAPQRSILDGLTGFVALSSISSFILLGVYRGCEPAADPADTTPLMKTGAANGGESATDNDDHRYLRQLARIEVPHDAKNPDKKPIALVQNLLIVSHDDNGVLAYALTDLVPDSFEDANVEEYTTRYAGQAGAKPALLQRRVPRVCTSASPVAAWKLSARVNDLSANQICVVQAFSRADQTPPTLSSSAPLPPCQAQVQEHLIVAALLLDKTMVLSAFRFRRRYTSRRHGRHPSVGIPAADGICKPLGTPGDSPEGLPASMKTALTLDGSNMPLPFRLLPSSLRLVRLFGWGNIDATQQADMRRRLTWRSLQEKGAPTHGPLCSIMLVAYDSGSNRSFVVHGAVEVTPAATRTTTTTTSAPSSPISFSPRSGEESLAIGIHWATCDPTPVLSDAITSLAVCTDHAPVAYATRVALNPLGATIPSHWIAGTVEGWLVSLRMRCDDEAYRQVSSSPSWWVDHIRPSPHKSIARNFPALHKEPISCVAVSVENDVVSGDIAQNVALTSLEYRVPGCSGTKSTSRSADDVSQQRLTSSSPLFPPSTTGGGVWCCAVTQAFAAMLSARVAFFLLLPLILALSGLVLSPKR